MKDLIHSRNNVIKLFLAVIYEFSQYDRVFVSGTPFQPSLMFAAKAGAYPSGAPSGAPLLVSFITLATACSRSGWCHLGGNGALLSQSS